jgi:hypothetical protein
MSKNNNALAKMIKYIYEESFECICSELFLTDDNNELRDKKANEIFQTLSEDKKLQTYARCNKRNKLFLFLK